MICINNPNNPTGALMSKELLGSIVEIARGVGAYILCDEVYRHLTQEDEWCESIVDLYEKGHLGQQYVQGLLARGPSHGLDRHAR